MALKSNPQKYNWPQKTCKLLKNKFPGSNWRVILMRIKQSEVFDKVSVTEICVFLTRRRTVTDFWFFGGLKRIFQGKKSHHVSMLTIGYLREEYAKFWFFIMCHDWLNVSGHSLLTHAIYAVFTLGLKRVCSKHVKQTIFPVNLLNLWSLLIMIVGAKCWNSKVLPQMAL